MSKPKSAAPSETTLRPDASVSSPDVVNISIIMSRFNTAFSLMSIIPLLTCFYLITVRFFSIQILEGLNGVYFLLALIIALVGLLAGHQLIRDMIKQLVQANTKLAKLNDAQAGFVSNVAHEFRAPLGVFKGALDNLADGLYGPLSKDQEEPVVMCQRELNRLVRLVRDLLELARIESGKLKLAQQELVLQELLKPAGQMFQGVAKERGLSLSVELPDEPVRVTGDSDRLQQVFVNLLGNAIKYTDVGSIKLRLTTDKTNCRVELSDTGRGIAAADLERVFDKFERVGAQTEEGSGLGLPIAKDIVELHRGRIWVESQLGQGSHFFIELPVNRSTV